MTAAAQVPVVLVSPLPVVRRAATTPELSAVRGVLKLAEAEGPHLYACIPSRRLSHASVSITLDFYTHALPGRQRQAADAFAQAMEA